MCLGLETSVQMSWLRGTSANKSELPMALELLLGPVLFSRSLFLPFPTFLSPQFIVVWNIFMLTCEYIIKRNDFFFFLHSVVFNKGRKFLLNAPMFWRIVGTIDLFCLGGDPNTSFFYDAHLKSCAKIRRKQIRWVVYHHARFITSVYLKAITVIVHSSGIQVAWCQVNKNVSSPYVSAFLFILYIRDVKKFFK